MTCDTCGGALYARAKGSTCRRCLLVARNRSQLGRMRSWVQAHMLNHASRYAASREVRDAKAPAAALARSPLGVLPPEQREVYRIFRRNRYSKLEALQAMVRDAR